jgi:hypothetical protein
MIATRESLQARMYCAAELKQFFFGEQPAGCFEDQFPLSSGQYRYKPLDGPGHHRLIKALSSSGPQRCYYLSEGRRHYFMVLSTASDGVLLVHAHTHTPYEA